jgi:iron complex outermembrane receptor protein
MLRFGFICLLSLTCVITYGQADTVLLQPVTVYGLPIERYLAGSQVVAVDSVLLRQQATHHLGEGLSFQFPLYFRSYGSGMASVISMRGTSPQHTAVLWNGININSFSLGQADFSILPVAAFGSVALHMGGGSARFGSGALGGTVLLSSSEQPTRMLSVSQEVGSFGRYGAVVKGSSDAGKFFFSTTFYNIQADNDFKLPDNTRQRHAAFRQYGLVQQVQYNFAASSSLKVDYWYHHAFREIQPPVGNAQSQDTQGDVNHRLSISYRQNGRLGLLKVGGGLVNDNIIYNNVPGEVFRWIGNISHEYSLPGKFNVSLQADWNHIVGRISEYGSPDPEEDRLDVSGSVQKTFGIFSLAANLRKPMITGMETPWLPYFGVDVELLEDKAHGLNLRANMSRNFRAPTLNDRYWLNAGDPDLNPETSHAGEVGLLWHSKRFKIGGTGYAQDIDQWIQWISDETGAFSPRNIKRVGIVGFEIDTDLDATFGPVSIHGRTSYGFVSSTTRETDSKYQAVVGKQLVYTPRHTGSLLLRSAYNGWSAMALAQFTGKRYTEASNSDDYALAPFVLVNISAGRQFEFDRHQFEFLISINNLFDTEYQLYSGRAMPGRNVEVRATYQLSAKTNRHDDKN